jgi:hypothetical protein
MYLFCNSRIHVITLYSDHVSVYYASMLQYWHIIWILIRTDHPYLGVGCHSPPPILRFFCRCRLVVVGHLLPPSGDSLSRRAFSRAGMRPTTSADATVGCGSHGGHHGLPPRHAPRPSCADDSGSQKPTPDLFFKWSIRLRVFDLCF